jgi:cysteinyl-tRNA synthetase
MYVCGITVYDLCHVGHARAMLAFDVAQRWLRQSGYRVTYVRNITDIDDKIIRRAVENGETIRSLTTRMIDEMYKDTDALGIQRPDHDPAPPDYVPQMLDIVGQLERKGLAYRSESGDVNYSVRKFDGYGKLSGKSIDELHAGERVARAGGQAGPAGLRALEGRQARRTRRRTLGQPLRRRAGRAGRSNAPPCPARCWRHLRHPRRRR